jgi:hypothetical protein
MEPSKGLEIETKKEEESLKGRMVTDIIIAILDKIPCEETKLITHLTSYYETLFNKAPEVLKTCDTWMPFIHILNRHIPAIKEHWQKEIYVIVKGD